MSRPTDGPRENPGQVALDQNRASHDHSSGHETCPRCQALEARIAELEAAAAERPDAGPTPPRAAHPTFPRWNSKLYDSFPMTGAKVGNCGLPHPGETG